MDRRREDVGGFSGGCFGGGIHHVHDRVVFAGADVHDDRTGSPPPQRQSHRPRHVGHMGQVAALGAVAVDDDRLARLDPAAEVLHGKVGTLSRSPNREEPQGEEAQAVEPGVEAAPLLAVELGQSVGAARVGWVILAGRQGRVRAIDAGRRGEDEGRDRHAAAEIQQADRAEDVGELKIVICLSGRL